MGIRLPSVVSNAKQALKSQQRVPKGHITVYVGEEEKTRYTVPIWYLSHPSFQELLRFVEEEFGFIHPMGGLTIPCKEDTFINLTQKLNSMREHDQMIRTVPLNSFVVNSVMLVS